MPVSAWFAFGGVSPPELGHAQGLPSVQIGLLQQFWSGAYPGSGGGRPMDGGGKYLAQVSVFSVGVQQVKVLEDAALQGCGPFFPLCFQLFYQAFLRRHLLAKQGDVVLQGLLLAAVFGFLELAFACQSAFGFGICVAARAQCVPFGFGLLHAQLGIRQDLVGCPFAVV